MHPNQGHTTSILNKLLKMQNWGKMWLFGIWCVLLFDRLQVFLHDMVTDWYLKNINANPGFLLFYQGIMRSVSVV